MTTAQYRALFDAALNKAYQYGFSVPNVGATVQKLAFNDPDDATMYRVVDRLMKRGYSRENLIAGCLHASYFMREDIQDIVGMPAYFTLGAVEAFGIESFRFSDAQLLSWLSHGLPEPAPNIHAWLTLPTMEIVDLTCLFTLKAAAPHLPIPHDFPVMGLVDRAQGMEWRPILVADDVVERLGAIRV